MSETYYTAEEVAERLKVSVNTILRECHDGNLGFTKVRGQYRISSEHLSIYMNPKEVTPND